MPSLNIGGKRVKISDDFLKLSPTDQQKTVDEIAAQMGATEAQAAPTAGDQFAKEASAITQGMDQPKAETGPYAVDDAKARYLQQMDGYTDMGGAPAGRGTAMIEGSHAGLMGGFDDEIAAGMLAPIDAGIDMIKGEGFDMGRAYTRKQKMLDLRKAQRREAFPGSSIAGEITGGLALGGTVRAAPAVGASLPGAGAIPTLFGRAPAVLAAPAEGAAYGAVYGAGEAKPGERLEGAGKGAVTGAALGTLLHGAGAGISKVFAKKPPVGAASVDVAAEAQAMYKASEAEGVVFNDAPIQRLKANLKVMAGDVNDKLRPKTAGTLEDLETQLNGPMTLEKFDELRQGISLDLKTAQGNDKRILTRMKDYLTNFADNIQPQDMTGGQKGVEYLNKARTLWAQAKKSETIERIMDQAGVDASGKYTQSGFANAIRREMNTLYKQIRKGKAPGWSKEEIALIKQMASGGSNSKLVNLMAKFDPKGVVSILGGQMVGSAVPGVGNVALPLGGYVAGRAADKAAMAAAERIRSGAASGSLPQLPKLPNYGMPFIRGAAAPTTEAEQARKRLTQGQ